MRAIVIRSYGGPEQLQLVEVPEPTPREGHVVVEVKAFGLNHAEIYFREGVWGDVAKISGIECVGRVKVDPSGRFREGQCVAALMGGMGRTIDGSYAEYTNVPISNVVALNAKMPWEELAALPESYATAWTCLMRNLALQSGQTVLIRGGTSALGQAAINIAAQAGANVIATTRRPERFDSLRALGAETVLKERMPKVDDSLSQSIRAMYPEGIDAVLDLIGTATVLDSMRVVRPDGHICMAGFLGGGEPIAAFNPLLHMPSGIQLSFFASAFTFGSDEYPLSDIPFQDIVDRTARGIYRAKPARIFRFEQIQEAHRLMEAGEANGKIVVVL